MSPGAVPRTPHLTPAVIPQPPVPPRDCHRRQPASITSVTGLLPGVWLIAMSPRGKDDLESQRKC